MPPERNRLLIEPFGIEIYQPTANQLAAQLLIEPFGIEMRQGFRGENERDRLLIEPFGIEIEDYKGAA